MERCASGWRAQVAHESSASLPGRRSPDRLPTCTASSGGKRFLDAHDGLAECLLHGADRLVAIDAPHDAPPLVALDDRQRVAQVDGHAIGDHLTFIVGALAELAAARVTGTGHSGGIEDFVEAGLAAAAHPPAGQAFDQ